MLLSKIENPRTYFQQSVGRLEFHIFEDSSHDVFNAVAFLRGKLVTKGTDTTELAVVFGKARVAPMKGLTIPKIELAAPLLATRLRQETQRAISLNIERRFMWTDSTTVGQWLHWFAKPRVFAANRVTQIMELTTVDEWIQVPTGDKNADSGTR